MFEKETWLPIPSTDGEYIASSWGFIRKSRFVRGRAPVNLKPWLNSTGYYVIGISVDGRVTRHFVHRLVCEAFHGPSPSIGHYVDHANRCPRDNRADNLRWATPSQNVGNSRDRKRKNPYRGVAKKGEKWRAFGCSQSRTFFIGTFDTAEDAARAYDDHARSHFGPFATLNFPEDYDEAVA